MRAAVTLIEVVLALTILMIMLGVSISFFRGEVERGESVVAAGLLRDLGTAIERWQIEAQRPWFSTRVPPGFPRDPWGHAFRIDPAKARFWSPGEDGEDDGGTQGKDVVGTYKPWPTAGLESPRKVVVRATGPDRLTVSWDPPHGAAAAIGFQVTRRADGEADWSVVATVTPTEPPEVVDLNAVAGVSCYYRVQSLPGPASGEPPPASAPVGAVLPALPSPSLQLSAEPAMVDAGCMVALKAMGKAGGAPLSHLLLAGTSYPVGPGEFTLQVEVPATGSGSLVLTGELIDQSGARTVRTAAVEVY